MLTDDVVNNIFFHVEKCWDYTYPTGHSLETTFARGLAPFFDVQQLGSPSTITDIKVSQISIDAKGIKTLKLSKSASARTNMTDKHKIPVWIGSERRQLVVPKSVFTPVRRPSVDLEGYKGDPEKILKEQINEYHNFAECSSRADGCDSIQSMVLQYGEEKGHKFVALSLSEFEKPAITEYRTKYSRTGKPNGYIAIGECGKKVYEISSFNSGSSNLQKRFNTSKIYYRIWEDSIQEESYNKEDMFIWAKNAGVVGKVD